MHIRDLEPKRVWGYFDEICKIPRTSKHEEKIRKFLIDFAGEHNLKAREDNVGNILIIKEADPGFEKRKSVVLQSHMDMVGEKNADTDHDWFNDPIVPKIDNGWITAGTTTLGVDDGIGIAAQMAILADRSVKTGRIECLFTVDEETGMTGAINLARDFFTSRLLINLDSEDEGELFIGCAGGIDTIGAFPYNPEKYTGRGRSYAISVTGLHGGHSGDEIHNGYANAVKLLTTVLLELSAKFRLHLSHIDAGNLRNAIPREGFAKVYIEADSDREIQLTCSRLENRFRKEFEATEKSISVKISAGKGNGMVIPKVECRNLLESLESCPHGVIKWSEEMENLVETSTNLASVKITGGVFRVVTSQRSSVDADKLSLAADIEEIFRKGGAEVSHTDGYPGWKPDTRSEILAITKRSYSGLFGNQPVVRAIHAGLECGLILEKYPGLDMISFGPTIKGAHTPEERINIETTAKFWTLLLDVLENIPEE